VPKKLSAKEEMRREEERRKLERERTWGHVCRHFMEARAKLPTDVFEMLQDFDALFYKRMEEIQAPPGMCIVALAHLFSPLIATHVASPRPSHISEQDWVSSIYESIRDCVIVAHSLHKAIRDGAIVATDDGLERPPPDGRIVH
jgi:hypothetical protein